jgi:hypothetical protein
MQYSTNFPAPVEPYIAYSIPITSSRAHLSYSFYPHRPGPLLPRSLRRTPFPSPPSPPRPPSSMADAPSPPLPPPRCVARLGSVPWRSSRKPAPLSRGPRPGVDPWRSSSLRRRRDLGRGGGGGRIRRRPPTRPAAHSGRRRLLPMAHLKSKVSVVRRRPAGMSREREATAGSGPPRDRPSPASSHSDAVHGGGAAAWFELHAVRDLLLPRRLPRARWRRRDLRCLRIRAGDLRSGCGGGIRNHGGGGGHPHLRCPLPAGSCERGIPGGPVASTCGVLGLDLRRRGPEDGGSTTAADLRRLFELHGGFLLLSSPLCDGAEQQRPVARWGRRGCSARPGKRWIWRTRSPNGMSRPP